MIIHVDMDAFYASVEERENPEIRGKPLIVGGHPDKRGVVSAANYPARQFGIHSAMPSARAVQKCPDLLIIHPRHGLYREVSQQIIDVFSRYTPIIEPLSLDEAFLDCSGSEKLYGDSIRIGEQIKADIAKELELIASVGVAPNKFLAKLASDHGKPDGFTVVTQDQVQDFLDPLPVDRLWGVGKVSGARFKSSGIHTVRELRLAEPGMVKNLMGQDSTRIRNLACGIDDRKVTPDSEVKSISQETTFAQNVSDYSAIESTAIYLTESVCYRLRKADLEGRVIKIKIRFADFHTISRSQTLESPSNLTQAIWKIVRSLIAEELQGQSFKIRLVGVGVSGFDSGPSQQTSIFDHVKRNTESDDSSGSLDGLTDKIRNRFGRDVIQLGRSVGSRKDP
ncbi:MAG: DNA polymerase IV [Gammaproteobacteria bacterium]|nr:DNA polymerase IV [Gammaproteobacteria bacterium]